MSGDVSLAANVTFPDDPAADPHRMVVLAIRSNLDDGSPEVVAKVDASGTIRLVGRGSRNAPSTQFQQIDPMPGARSGASIRIGIEKLGDLFTLYVSRHVEPLHPIGASVSLRLQTPFQAGIGFCAHQPNHLARALVSHVVLKNTSGMVR